MIFLTWRTLTSSLLAAVTVPFLTNVAAADEITEALEGQGIYVCHPPMEQLLVGRDLSKISAFDSAKSWAADALKNISSSVDSVSFSVFGPSGDPIYQNRIGQLRSNESETVDSNTLYRVASISKLFTAMEIFHLVDQGYLDLDIDIKEYIPKFKYPLNTSETWRSRLGLDPADYNPTTPLNADDNDSDIEQTVTTRQLLSHTGGILANVDKNQIWQLFNNGNAVFEIANKSSQVFDTIDENPLALNPATSPAYSNLGFVLAQHVVENVYQKHRGGNKKFAEIIREDILEPLNMTSSFYALSKAELEKLAVPNGTDSVWADMDLTISDGAFGLSTTLDDLTTFGQAILSNYHGKGQSSTLPIKASTVRDWLRPEYVFEDNISAVGHPWEIFYYPPPVPSNDSAVSSRGMQVYTKDGSLPGYSTFFMLDPQRQFGAIWMITGSPVDEHLGFEEIATTFGAAFSEYRATILAEKTGTYCLSADANNSTIPSDNSGGTIVVNAEQDSLWTVEWTYRGTNMLEALELNALISPDGSLSPRFPIWPTSEKDIYRTGTGRPPTNHFEGCMMQFVNMGNVFTNNVPSDIVAFVNDEIIMPAGGLRYSRSQCSK